MRNGLLTVRNNEHNVLDTVGGNVEEVAEFGKPRENPRGTIRLAGRVKLYVSIVILHLYSNRLR